MVARVPLKPVDPSFVPSVSLTKLPATSSIVDIISVLDRDGGVILTNYATKQDIDKIGEELRPYQTKDKAFDDAPVKADLDIVSSNTHVIHGLVGKSPTIARIIESETMEKLRNEILTETFQPVWEDRELEEFVIPPLLSFSGAFNVGYGAPRQVLHRDDWLFGVRHDHTFDLSKEQELGCLVAGSKTTRENGATMFIPGSHRWPDERTGELDKVCFVEMEPGDVFFFLASAMHGAGHNSVPNSIRTLYGVFFIRGHLRQEENQYLAIPHSQVLKMSDKMKTLLGYKMTSSLLGAVNSQDPMTDLPGVLERASA